MDFESTMIDIVKDKFTNLDDLDIDVDSMKPEDMKEIPEVKEALQALIDRMETVLRFNRTFGVERAFNKYYSETEEEEGLEVTSFDREMALVYQTITAVGDSESEEEKVEAYTNLMSLEHLERIHRLLKFMYAEVDDSGVLIQNEGTRETYDRLVDEYDLVESDIMMAFFRKVFKS